MQRITVEDFLEHYGVKGMRWGVINEDDRTGLSAEFKSFSNKQKYGSMNDKEEKIEDQNFFKRLTPAQKKAALVFGGAVVVAGLAYGAHHYNLSRAGGLDPRTLLDGDPFSDLGAHAEGMRAYMDKGLTLKSGSLVARVSKDIETNIRPGGFFSAHELHDIESYKDFLGSIGGHTNYFKATKDIKVPSTKEYVRILGKAMDHPDVLKARGVNISIFNKLSSDDKEKALFKLAAQELARKDFAFSLNPSTVDGLLPKRFVSGVLSSGYTSVIDYNNASGSIAQAPLRHFDGSMFKFFSSEPLTSEVKQLAKLNADKNMEIIGDFYDSFKHRLDERIQMINQTVIEFLSHYGVKGMRWGVRKKTASEDAKRHAANRKKSVSELSDKELQQLVNRMNMQQQYSRLTPSATKRGHEFVKGLLAVGITINGVMAFAKSPAGEAIKKKLSG